MLWGFLHGDFAEVDGLGGGGGGGGKVEGRGGEGFAGVGIDGLKGEDAIAGWYGVGVERAIRIGDKKGGWSGMGDIPFISHCGVSLHPFGSVNLLEAQFFLIGREGCEFGIFLWGIEGEAWGIDFADGEHPFGIGCMGSGGDETAGDELAQATEGDGE